MSKDIRPEIIEDLQMIRETMRWCYWPYLPMKNRETQEVGFVFDDEKGHKRTIYHANLFAFFDMKLGEKKKVKKTEFKTVLEMMEAGWRID